MNKIIRKDNPFKTFNHNLIAIISMIEDSDVKMTFLLKQIYKKLELKRYEPITIDSIKTGKKGFKGKLPSFEQDIERFIIDDGNRFYKNGFVDYSNNKLITAYIRTVLYPKGCRMVRQSYWDASASPNFHHFLSQKNLKIEDEEVVFDPFKIINSIEEELHKSKGLQVELNDLFELEKKKRKKREL
ncbi:MAG: hypothetical protein H7A23_01755 [Leptospiraceae bacterium]|nr:hypothetical protein [Leptospiraceae bacterium]MCP5493258.1 hypothetical protein [Leptospiraceae bacterium]